MTFVNTTKVFDLEAVISTPSSKILTIIQLIYGLPSFIILILFNLLLGCSRKYSNSFYRLVQLDLLVNAFCYFNTWIGLRLYEHPFGVALLKTLESLLPGSLYVAKYFLNFFFHMQFCPAITLSVHRITSVFFFSRYEKFWSRYYPLFGLFFCTYSVLSSLDGFPIHVAIVNDTLTKFYDLEDYTRYFDRTAVFSIVYFVLILITGMTTSILIKWKIKESHMQDGGGVGKKLSKIALTYCAIYSGNLLWSVMTALDLNFPFLPNIVIRYRPISLVFASDMMTLALPFVLLFYDTNIRSDVLRKSNATSTVTSRVLNATSLFISS